jgi:hypothetical protein
MIQLFKIGSAERLVLLFVFYILIHAPFLIWNEHVLVQEIMRMRLGEKLSQGWRLYAQVADETGPIPALIYAILAKFGLMHFKAQRLLAAALLWQQATWLNQMAQRYQLVSDRNFLIAFFYLLFAHVSVDAISLSPALMACSFLLYSFGTIFRILKDGANPDDAMWMGLWLGFAFVSYQPGLIFLLPLFVACLLFSGLRLNHYLLSFSASLLPALGTYIFFLYSGGKAEFLHCFSAPIRMQEFYGLVSLQYLMLPALFLFGIAVLGWAYSNQNSRVNFHRLGFNVFFFCSVAGFAGIFFGNFRTGEGLLLLLAPAAILMAQFMLHSRKRLLNEGVGILLIVLFIGNYYFGFGAQAHGTDAQNKLYLGDAPKGFSANFSGKSLLLLSNDFRYYRNNPPATRFFRFYLSGLSKKQAKTYEGLVYWHQCLAEDPPQLIYDPGGLLPDLSLRIPEFSRCYRMTFYPNLYEAVPGTTFGATISDNKQ